MCPPTHPPIPPHHLPAAYLEVNAVELLAKRLPAARVCYEFCFLDQIGVGGWVGVQWVCSGWVGGWVGGWVRGCAVGAGERQRGWAGPRHMPALRSLSSFPQEGVHYSVDCGTDTFTSATANWGEPAVAARALTLPPVPAWNQPARS